jgi:uncharacterized membrane protein YgcG
MNAPVFRAAAMSAALTVAAGGIASTALAPPPAPSLVPARVGGSVSYHYDAIETGPRGTTTTRAVLTLTRVVNDRVTITVTPDEGPATAVVARLGRDGALQADATNAPSSDIPMDRPLGGLPGDARGFVPARAARVAIPDSVRVLGALLASRPATGTNARTWPFATVVQSSESSVAMTARAGDSHGTETTLIADGSGEVQIAAARDSAAAQPRSDGGTRSGGGQGGGGQRGGVLFPGGGQGGQGGGVYGSGRGRRGGQGGGQSPGGQTSGANDQQRLVPATVSLHVESTFRAGRLILARGSDAATSHAAGGDVATTVRWTLTAL